MKKEEKERLHEDDQFIKLVRGTWARVTARRRVMRAVVVAAVIVLVVVGTVSVLQEESGKRAKNAIDRAETIEQMEQVAQKYPWAVDLGLRLGDVYVQRGENGDMEKAEGVYERALAGARNGLERGLAELALGKVEMELKKHERALELLSSAAKVAEARLVIGSEANWYAGRCLELMKRPEEARERYALVEGGVWKSMADFRAARMHQESME